MHTTPLPSFSWANGAEVWNCMLEKDANYSKLRNEKVLERHPSLVDSYRTILFDWLSEVSHECKFHRETYHLALDFIDRYLAATSNVGKLQLQLIGTTCLFLAAKFEEIRPPTVIEFADLTDGACKADDIIENEVVILSALNWEITPMTSNSWLNIYMQILLNLDQEEKSETTSTISNVTNSTPLGKNNDINKVTTSKRQAPIVDENSQGGKPSASSDFPMASTRNDSFILPTNNGILRHNHKLIASVIDLALLHLESLKFSNSILTAAALFHFTSELTVRQCTGYRYQELVDCIHWLQPFVDTIKEIKELVVIATSKGETNSAQMHTHIATASLLEKAVLRMESSTRQSIKRKACSLLDGEMTDSEIDSVLSSPTKPSTILLTPPSSTRKSRRVR